MMKETVKLLLNLNQERKYFLAVWIIICFFVSIGIFGGIGRTFIVTEHTDAGVVGVDVRQMVLNDTLIPFLVLIIISFVSYVIAGLKPIKTMK